MGGHTIHTTTTSEIFPSDKRDTTQLVSIRMQEKRSPVTFLKKKIFRTNQHGGNEVGQQKYRSLQINSKQVGVHVHSCCVHLGEYCIVCSAREKKGLAFPKSCSLHFAFTFTFTSFTSAAHREWSLLRVTANIFL